MLRHRLRFLLAVALLRLRRALADSLPAAEILCRRYPCELLVIRKNPKPEGCLPVVLFTRSASPCQNPVPMVSLPAYKKSHPEGWLFTLKGTVPTGR
jgi:hypothetical protein